MQMRTKQEVNTLRIDFEKEQEIQTISILLSKFSVSFLRGLHLFLQKIDPATFDPVENQE